MQEEYLFPTPVWWCDLDINLDELYASIKDIQYNHDTQVRSNVGGYQSQDFDGEYLLTCDDALGNLARQVQGFAEECYARFGSVATKVRLANLWINVNNGPDYNQVHTHPGAVLSGAFYVKVPEDSGRLVFHRDHASAFNYASVGTMEDFAIGQEDAAFMYNQFTYPPVENRLIMFPAWLPHGVQTGDNIDERISISFNLVPYKVDVTGKYGKLEQKQQYAM
jgi:uncharacterized protein (TIGR02466 family)